MALNQGREGYSWTNYTSRPKPDRNAVLGRLDLFVDGKYASTNLSSVLYEDKRDDANHVKIQMWSAPGRSKPTFAEAKRKFEHGSGKPVEKGVKFGPSWTNHWLMVELVIPSAWAKKASVEFHFDPSCEAMLFDESGSALQGITGGFDYNRRVEYIVPPAEVKKGKCLRYIEVSANGVFGMQPADPANPNVFYTLEQAQLVVVNEPARALMYDFDTLKQVATVLPAHSPVANVARRIANDIMNTFRCTQESIEECRKLAEELLKDHHSEELQTALATLSVEQNGTLWAIGYCHIDTAWLWPWSATQQKIARSWTSQLDLMDRYPEYIFMATAAQHFKWLEELYPDVFKRVQEKVKSGQFEVNGACWLEMDGNMPSGESFCRQFLYGQKYFQSRFGKRSDVFVLPDTFGFGPQLPQIARLSGCESFFTHKLNWNTVNVFPLTNFNWVGLDGSQLLAHLTPILRYDSVCTIEEITRAYPHHQDLEVAPDAVIAFGHGDGGGGPRPLLLERLRRARNVGLKSMGASEEMPLIKQGSSLSDFYSHLREISNNGKALPDWNGEMYLEAHRGVTTSQSNTKQNFRRSEIALREVELFSTLASLRTGFAYPKERLDKVWEDLCLCMFHDTLPGSSIRLAVEDYDRMFASILERAAELKDSALRALSEHGVTRSGAGILNTLPGIQRHEIVEASIGSYFLATASKGELVSEESSLQSTDEVRVYKHASEGIKLQNALISVTINNGRLTSIYDHGVGRELLAPRTTAGFRLYQDETHNGDAWDVEQYELQNFEDLAITSIDVLVSGPHRATVDCKLKIGSSQGTIKISLDAVPSSFKADARSLIRFDCHVDWVERHKMLKFVMPLALWSDFATYDTAFGVLRRPTTRNNTWEDSKFEVAAHKFADYSEFGYGVAILNNCKYGYAAQGNLLTLSLLRGPTAPDGEADIGPHDFGFAVYPHLGTYAESDVQEVAHIFNNPMQVSKLPISSKLARVPFTLEGSRNVLLESIKRAEEDFDSFSFVETAKAEKTVIIRMHEHMGGHAKIRFCMRNIQVSKAELVNVLEDAMETVDMVTNLEQEYIDLEFRGFEIKTLKLKVAA